MPDKKNVLGIDIGSISIAIAEISENGSVIKTTYVFHNGNIRKTLSENLKEYNLNAIGALAVTSTTPDLIQQARRYDSRISFMSAAKHLNDRVGSLLIVGGEKFGVAMFDNAGEYRNYRSNSSCAAGTGSFLDQQAKRLNLSGIEEFSTISLRNSGDIPKIASRCAVFAKTDLIHAQQEGYSLEAICDGLSYGLAKNIVDTLFNNSFPPSPLIFAGGVSKNSAVVQHISQMLEMEIIVDEHSGVYGAIGAALNLIEERSSGLSIDELVLSREKDIINYTIKDKQFDYDPLELKLSDYPDFKSLKRYEYNSRSFPVMSPVEIDIYQNITQKTFSEIWMGIDIGSTSTKAVLLDNDKEVLAGLYSRTSGRPVEAVQTLFEAIDELGRDHGVKPAFLGVGTTGSGRKFIGEIIDADLVLDEISAHARAACELNSSVDTIIEIGGQDSKFTTLNNGMVTFSIMNNVCAAGTGSFIEEQAKKLDCALADYSGRTEGVVSPMTSDKCTVFMERDMNHYLSNGYEVDEVLASALHSVRDNYLTKVALAGNIGNSVFFQGATAKNKALVAAFEQKLQKPIMVSKYCHLTGALGVALQLHDSFREESSFRGIELYKHTIPIRSEVCELCTNHCKIKIAEVNRESVAFGFLCGRDYETQKFVRENSSGFDLMKSRKNAFKTKRPDEYSEDFIIGLPAALHMVDELPLWQKFFDLLSIKTKTSEHYRDGLKDGKKLSGAEFCAPIASLHGHAGYLAGIVDYLFLPDFLEVKNRKSNGRRHYCYYTQYAPALISELEEVKSQTSMLNPVLHTIQGTFHTRVELYRMLKSITRKPISFLKVSSAYDRALKHYETSIQKLKQVCKQELESANDISAVLIGRPYTILPSAMNNKIPEIFSKLGIKTFFQDMLSYEAKDVESIAPLLKEVHWHYASKIFEAAEVIVNTRGVYPVLVTSFKCTPDAFVIDIFKKMMDSRKKPYLILQLDEHDSSVGYETRVEAGIRAFRNHHQSTPGKVEVNYRYNNPNFLKGKDSLKGKTLLIPNFDTMPCRLIEASLKSEGIDARLLGESKDSMKRSMSLNTGQCLPVSMIAQSAIDYISEHDLDPASTVLWSIDSNISCNLGVFPHITKSILESRGNGLENVEIYRGIITYFDMSLKITTDAYFSYMFGGLLKKMGCKIRPYEQIKGSTDRAIVLAMDIFYNAFLHDTSKEEALSQAIPMFEKIKTSPGNRPKVAIFGDIYARDNEVLNQNMIRTIEENGGEAITTPYSEYMQIIANPFIQKWFREGDYTAAAAAGILSKAFPIMEKKYYTYFNRVLKEPKYRHLSSPEEVLKKFHIKMLHAGESLETILKIFTLINNYPDIALFVQTSPSLCCPSLVTEAMSGQIENLTGIPVVNIEYDGTDGFKNDDIIPYLKYPRKARAISRKAAQ